MSNDIAAVRELLSSVAGSETVDSLADDDLFFDSRVIDSLHLVEIVDRFESQFGVEVHGEDLSPDNFGSIAAMARFLGDKRGSGQPSR
jgi:acyl carrier protein